MWIPTVKLQDFLILCLRVRSSPIRTPYANGEDMTDPYLFHGLQPHNSDGRKTARPGAGGRVLRRAPGSWRSTDLAVPATCKE